MHPMLNIAIRAARAAGDVIARNIDRIDTLKIESKQRNDFVSEVDFKAEAAIVATLTKAYPDHAVLGEESGMQGQVNSNNIWIVDPLDGTTNFLHGLPHFCVSIALKANDRLDQAVIYNPISQELFTASRGQGAWLNNKRIRVSSITSLDKALLGTDFSNRDGTNLDEYLNQTKKFNESCVAIRRAGSAALDLAYVAAGRLDGCWISDLSSWDIAAGGLIIREAGGLISDFKGGDTWLDSGQVVAGNPKIMHAMLQILKQP